MKARECYEHAAKYGITGIYVKGYNQGISDLLQTIQDNDILVPNTLDEVYNLAISLMKVRQKADD